MASASAAAAVPEEVLLTQSQANLQTRLDRGSVVALGVPEAYADAVLDDTYMETLVKATNKLETKRRRARDRYTQLNRYILIALVLQALVMTYIALYKTLLAPDFTFTMDVVLEDVDMMVMLDASNHLGETRLIQQSAASKFSQSMAQAMEDLRHNSRLIASRMMRAARESKKGGWLDFTFGKHTTHNERNASEPFDRDVRIFGGRLRLATGLFNALNPRILHPLTLDVGMQKPALEQTSRSDYAAHSRWHTAMQVCRDEYRRSRKLEADFFQKFPRRAQRCNKPAKEPGEDCGGEKTSQEACASMPFCSWKAGEDGEHRCLDKKPLCRKQFCIIIGDSDATCGKQAKEQHNWKEKRNRLCSKEGNEGLCPSGDALQRMGGSVEYPSEMDDCRDAATDMLERASTDPSFAELPDDEQLRRLNEEDDIKLIMLFTTHSEVERQIRLRNPHFRSFVEETTGCKILGRPMTVDNPRTGLSTTFNEYYLHDESCTRFIMEMDSETMLERAQEIRSLLSSDITGGSSPNPDKDWRYLIFLLGPLNLLCYLGSSFIVRTVTQIRDSARRAMGVKKKMIKVTKQLVEKVPMEVLPEFAELEMAEIQKLKVPIEFGRKLNLRARLKGGFLRSAEDEPLSCDGRQFEEASDWYFEPVGGGGELGREASILSSVTMASHVGAAAVCRSATTRRANADGGVQIGQVFRIRNNSGQYLCIDENGSRFFGQEEASAMEAPPGDEMHFSAEPCSETADQLYLSDIICLRCLGTGGYLRVTKGGDIDGIGRPRAAETQLQVDLGGMPLTSGSCITLHHDILGKPIHGSPFGGLVAGASTNKGEAYKVDEWRYWLIEKVESQCRAETRIGTSSAHMEGSPTASFVALSQADRSFVKEGDVVSLRSLNGHWLEVDSEGFAFCGGPGSSSSSSSAPPPAPRASAGSSASSRARGGGQPGGFIQEFLVHRVGVTSVNTFTNKLRLGGRVCLRPLGRNDDNEPRRYLRWTNEAGGYLVADAPVSSEDVSFTLDQATLHAVLRPLNASLNKGDCDLMYGQVWDKRQVHRIEGLSAAWTTKDNLTSLRGPISVVSEEGGVSIPKNCDAWVAVVRDGVDLFRASSRAREVGAAGLIVRCDEPCSLDRLGLGGDGRSAPCLPIVFICNSEAEALLETGLVLKGCEFRRQYVTNVMRALGNLRHMTTSESRLEATEGVFDAIGAALQARMKEDNAFLEADKVREAADAARAAKTLAVEAKKSSAKGKKSVFKWKVNANTNYYWATANAGTGAMKNIYKRGEGDLEPRRRGDTGAGSWSEDVDVTGTLGFTSRTRCISVTHISAEDVQNMQLSEDLREVFHLDQSTEQALETLGKESDFKIEYIFEEVEIGIGEKPEDLDHVENAELEQDYIGFRGKMIRTVGVPRSQFWIVALLLIFSSALMAWKLYEVMTSTSSRDDVESEDAAYLIDLPASIGRVLSSLSSLSASVAATAAPNFLFRAVAVEGAPGATR